MKKKRIKRVFIIILCSILTFSLLTFSYVYLKLDKVKSVKINKSNVALGIQAPAKVETKQQEDIINIALFGVDVGRDKYDVPHSDSIIIVTLDEKHKNIKLSSIMRDTYVDVEGHNKTKINDAYFYGGPQLAIKTLNQNFNLNIKDYVTVNFFTLEKVIDALGGVDIDIKNYEVDEINIWIDEVAGLEKKKPIHVTKAGAQHLTGLQAVAYSRMRHVGNGDFERTQRQRTVMEKLFQKVKDAGISSYPSIVDQVLPDVETSLSKLQIVQLGTIILTNNLYSVDQERFPVDGYCNGETINGIWYLVPKPDIDTLENQLNDFIYENKHPEKKTPLF